MQARSRFYLRVIVWRRRSEYPKVMSFLMGSGGVPSRNFFKINMCWYTICCIWRDNFKKCYSGILFLNNTPCSLSYSVLRQGILTSCALTSSRLDDFFQYSIYIILIPCNDNNIFGGGWVFLFFFFLGGGKLLPLKYPRVNPSKKTEKQKNWSWTLPFLQTNSNYGLALEKSARHFNLSTVITICWVTLQCGVVLQ